MTDTRYNGGAAFPQSTFTQAYPEHSGMDLRDWFAGQAMAARIIALGDHFHDSEAERLACKAETASRAYEMADAMLATRSSSKEA